MARRVGQAALPHRALMFVAVLGLSAGVVVISAHQEDFNAGFGIAMVGFIAIAGMLWIVAWLRGAWRLHALAMSFAGLVAVIGAGSTAVSEVVLMARGELVDVVVATQMDADEDGYRLYALVPATESTSVRGNLHTKQEFDDGQAVTVLVDRNGFVRPMLPEDMDTVFFVIIVLAGVGFLAVCVIGFGYPLAAGRHADRGPQ